MCNVSVGSSDPLTYTVGTKKQSVEHARCRISLVDRMAYKTVYEVGTWYVPMYRLLVLIHVEVSGVSGHTAPEVALESD